MARVVSRRTLLGLAITAGGAGLGMSLGWRQYAGAKERVFLRLANWVASSEHCRALGREYLAGRPEEASHDVLLQRLARDLEPFPYGMSDAEVRQFSQSQIQRDFESGRTVTLQGWILSQTELRVCALAAVLGDESGS